MHEISVTATFKASHAIRLYDGSLEPLHEHDWRVCVTVASEKLDAIDCVMDFHELEAIVGRAVDPFRDGNLNGTAPFKGSQLNPAAERFAEHLAEAISSSLPKRVQLVSVAVTEAPECIAVFRP